MRKKKIDPALERYYTEGAERDRLATHQLERDRTLHLLNRFLPQPPATILDVGGAAGIYAFPLGAKQYAVHLVDPIQAHIDQAKAIDTHRLLASCTVDDARHLDFPDNYADVVLLLGPLYHLTLADDRKQALDEAYRVLKPNGLLFSAAISRFASFIDAMNKQVVYQKFSILEEDLQTGLHYKAKEQFTFGYLHKPEDFRKELANSRFHSIQLLAIEGPVWKNEIVEALYQDKGQWEKLISLIDLFESEPSVLGASAHILGVARK